MFGIGPMELVLILVVALLVFGPKRLPELARTLGRGMGEFRRASNDLRQSLALDDLQKDLREGLSGENSIQRPAQAGDSLPAAKKSPESTADASGESTGISEKAEPDTADAGPEASAEPTPHPGELPLDNDYEHHEVAMESESVDSPAAQPPKTPKTPSPPLSAAPPVPNKGDSELGNVPVSRSAVGVRKPDSERG